LKRGLVSFFHAFVKAAAERYDAVLPLAEGTDEVADITEPSISSDHVPEVLTLF
jgi:hypothetical protein